MGINRLAAASTCAAFAVMGCGFAGCGSVADNADSSSNKTETTEQVVEVYAASSLTDVFTELERRYEALHPEVDVRLNLAGSSTLVRQINDGAPADIFAPADRSVLDQLDPPDAGLGFETSEPYATNQIVLVVPADNRRSINAVSDLEATNVLTAKCIAGVPCGDATDAGLARAGVALGLATEETNVRSVLAKVASGEVDAGFVYQTDVQIEPQVKQGGTFESPILQLVVVRIHPISPSGAEPERDLDNPSSGGSASDFFSFVVSEDAFTVFADAGFERP